MIGQILPLPMTVSGMAGHSMADHSGIKTLAKGFLLITKF
jgi:isopentenyl diphosphate isomerase/L-lactate dehydrogenase-like FMN-dependent dehydrogenase